MITTTMIIMAVITIMTAYNNNDNTKIIITIIKIIVIITMMKLKAMMVIIIIMILRSIPAITLTKKLTYLILQFLPCSCNKFSTIVQTMIDLLQWRFPMVSTYYYHYFLFYSICCRLGWLWHTFTVGLSYPCPEILMHMYILS